MQVPECARLAQEAVDEGMCVVIGLQVNAALSAAKVEWHVLDSLPLRAVTVLWSNVCHCDHFVKALTSALC